MAELFYREAVTEAIAEEMRRDPRVFVMGEDVAIYGGAYGATRGLMDEFGEERVRDTAISEAAITGAAVGASMAGMRQPGVELAAFAPPPAASVSLAPTTARLQPTAS